MSFLIVILLVFVVGFLAGSFFGGRDLPMPRAVDSIGPGEGARLGRIETTVETMSAELERLAEGQRFLTKLLAERSSDAKE